MGGKYLDGALKDFARARFPRSRSDLFAVATERYLSLAKGSSERLNRIVDDLLDLSRFAAGKVEWFFTGQGLVTEGVTLAAVGDEDRRGWYFEPRVAQRLGRHRLPQGRRRRI